MAYRRPRTFLRARRRRGNFSGGQYGLGHSSLIRRPFGWQPRNAGTTIKRVYETQTIFQNTGNNVDAAGWAFRIMNTLGQIDLELWTGTPGVGTLLSTFPEFRDEASKYFDIFRWCKPLAIECELVPLVDVSIVNSESSTDESIEADKGKVMLTTWDGDQNIVSPAGIPQYDYTEFSRLKHKNFSTIGSRAVKLSKVPQIFQSEDNLFPAGTKHYAFPRCFAWESVQARTVGQYYPFYGFMLFWNHPNLAANAAKSKFIIKWRVMIQWNTLYDTDIQAKKSIEKQQFLDKLAAQPDPNIGDQPPEEDEDMIKIEQLDLSSQKSTQPQQQSTPLARTASIPIPQLKRR